MIGHARRAPKTADAVDIGGREAHVGGELVGAMSAPLSFVASANAPGVSVRSKSRYRRMRGCLSRCASSSSVWSRGESTPFFARNSVLR